MAEFILSAFSDEAGIDLDEQIRACQANGITHMELRGLPQGNVSSLTTDDAWVLKAKLDAEGMQEMCIRDRYYRTSIRCCVGRVGIILTATLSTAISG